MKINWGVNLSNKVLNSGQNHINNDLGNCFSCINNYTVYEKDGI